MIIPLISEEEWLPVLQALPSWAPPTTRTMVLAPHPDDETLGAGGLIFNLCQAGIDVIVLAVSDGENAYENVPDLGTVRRQEQQNALTVLGVSPQNIHRLHLPDSSLADNLEALRAAFADFITPDTHVVAPWTGDFHPDHIAVGQAATEVAQKVGAKLTYYFFWTWHQGTPTAVQHLPLRQYPLSASSLQKKLTALACHHSQLHHPFAEPILPEALLAPAYRSFEVFLSAHA